VGAQAPRPVVLADFLAALEKIKPAAQECGDGVGGG
jgi:hypothetical protein